MKNEEKERLIVQVKYNNKMYNKFILIVKELDVVEVENKETREITKTKKSVYKAKELLANKDVSINYYNRLFVEGDLDSGLKNISLAKLVDFLKKSAVVTYINNNLKDFNKILK